MVPEFEICKSKILFAINTKPKHNITTPYDVNWVT